MRKNLTFPSFILLLLFSFPFSSTTSEQVSINIELLSPIDSNGFSIRIEVKNLSKNKFSVLEDRKWDYKWTGIKSLGNYIVQIEKFESGSFQLFPPSADIGYIPSSEKYIDVPSLQTITDTFHISGNSFSRIETKKRGFPSGTYRLRVSFNASEWSSSVENSSEWARFDIK